MEHGAVYCHRAEAVVRDQVGFLRWLAFFLFLFKLQSLEAVRIESSRQIKIFPKEVR